VTGRKLHKRLGPPSAPVENYPPGIEYVPGITGRIARLWRRIARRAKVRPLPPLRPEKFKPSPLRPYIRSLNEDMVLTRREMYIVDCWPECLRVAIKNCTLKLPVIEIHDMMKQHGLAPLTMAMRIEQLDDLLTKGYIADLTQDITDEIPWPDQIEDDPAAAKKYQALLSFRRPK
jgi:hypothetical protein